MSLEALKELLQTRFDVPREVSFEIAVRVGVPRLDVNSPGDGGGRKRFLRITPIPEGPPEWQYEVQWSAYGSTDQTENGDGRCGGDVEFVARAFKHYIVDGVKWHEVPEFRLPPRRSQ